MKKVLIVILLFQSSAAHADINLGLGLSWGYGWQSKKILNADISSDYLNIDSVEYKDAFPIYPTIQIAINTMEFGLAIDQIAKSDDKEIYGGRLQLFIRLLNFNLYKFKIKKVDCDLNLFIFPGIGMSFLHKGAPEYNNTMISFSGMLNVGPEIKVGPFRLRIQTRLFLDYDMGFYSTDDAFSLLHLLGGGVGIEGAIILAIF